MNRNDLIPAVRDRLRRLPPPHEHHYGVVPLAPPEDGIILGKEARRHQNAIAAIGEVDALVREINDPFYIGRILVRQEAVSSSSIEGTNSTLDELLRSEEDAEIGRDEALQVRDYALLLERIVPLAAGQGSTIFDQQLISEMHRSVMAHDTGYRDVPGELRAGVVWIGGIRNIAQSTFNPPPPENVADCLGETLSYLRQEGMQVMTQSIVTRMAVAHAHFEAVHPFLDGNGRVGRLIMPLMMAADGHAPLYLSPYIEANKPAYIDALKAAQQRLQWSVMVGFISDAIVGTVAEVRATRAALAELGRAWRGRRKFRAGSAALRALPLLPHYPVITAKRLAQMLSISAPAAGAALDQLVEADVLRERTGYRRNRIFAAHEALAIINRPFGIEVEAAMQDGKP